MASKPFRGYASQYEYRQALARQRGYDSKYEQEQAQKAARTDPTFKAILQKVPSADKSKWTALLWQQKGALGEHVKGKPKELSPAMIDLFEKLEDDLGDKRYLLWRWLYA